MDLVLLCPEFQLSPSGRVPTSFDSDRRTCRIPSGNVSGVDILGGRCCSCNRQGLGCPGSSVGDDISCTYGRR